VLPVRSLLFAVLVLFTFSLAAPADDAALWRSGQVTTVAGGSGPGLIDGPAREAQFNHPTWLDVVAGDSTGAKNDDIYVIDRLNRAIRKISNGVVSTYNVRAAIVDNGPKDLVPFDFDGPFGGGIVIETGSGCGGGQFDRGMFIASSGSHQLMLVSFVGLLGNRDGENILGEAGVAGDAGSRFHTPTGLARSFRYTFFDRSIYVADTGSHTIRKLEFFLSAEACPRAGGGASIAGAPGLPGSNDGPGKIARFNGPRGVAGAPDGSVYVTDTGNHTIRRIFPDGSVTTVAGTAGIAGSDDGPGLLAHLNTPSGIDVNAAGEVFIADTGNSTIRMLTTDGMLVTIAGKPGQGGYADGDPAEARFAGPVGLRVSPDGALLVADTSNNAIRAIRQARQPKRRAARR
jgi:hypothetical protein